jgi:hypothetical protein
VTNKINADLIQKNGLKTGYAIADGYEATAKAEMELELGEEFDESEFFEGIEIDEDQWARYLSEEQLEYERPNHLPNHKSSNFFFTNLWNASQYRRNWDEFSIFEIDTDELPKGKQCYMGDKTVADKVIEPYYINLSIADCNDLYTEEMEELCKQVEINAKEYWKTMIKFPCDEEKCFGYSEVLCNFDIPPEFLKIVEPDQNAVRSAKMRDLLRIMR